VISQNTFTQRDTWTSILTVNGDEKVQSRSKRTGVSGHSSLIASPPKDEEKAHLHPPELLDEATSHDDDVKVSTPPFPDKNEGGNKGVCDPPSCETIPPPLATSHTQQKHHVQASSPSTLIDDEGRNKEQASLTTTDLIYHGHLIVEVEKLRYGKKTMIWRIRYRNREGLLLSLFWWYWSSSWAQAFATFIITHALSEIALWYLIGEAYSYTFGTENVHPSDFRMPLKQNKNANDTPPTRPTNQEGTAQSKPVQKGNGTSVYLASSIVWMREEPHKPAINKEYQALVNGKNREDFSQPPMQKEYRARARQILFTNKGKRKKFDRPKRHRIWQEQSNANNIPIQHSSQDNAALLHKDNTSQLGITKRLETSIGSSMLNALAETATIQPSSKHDNANHFNNKMVVPPHNKTKKPNILAVSLMHMAFKKTPTVHNTKEKYRADCAWLGVWPNGGMLNDQHQQDSTRATNYVLAGFYPRDVIKWMRTIETTLSCLHWMEETKYQG